MCERCLYKNNCQFLAKHKSVVVEGCTAFFDEEIYRNHIRSEAMKELAAKIMNMDGSEYIESWYELGGQCFAFQQTKFIEAVQSILNESLHNVMD